MNDYDIIVVGGGHAGCEAAHAAARLGVSTLLISVDMEKYAQMSCNPAVGGIAKGQIVREIDALGGLMGLITDRSAIQRRMLNRSKGPAMWSPRAQCDRMRFSTLWRRELEKTENLDLWQDSVVELVVEDGMVKGVVTRLGVTFSAKAVVLTNGTFLNGLMHVGPVMIPGGRVAEPASKGITEQLVTLGFTADRMKTGTPVRIDARSVDFSKTIPQPGDTDFHRFSFLSPVDDDRPQMECYTVYTNPEAHEILRSSLDRSPLYNGQIQSIGPRYCPSIETKIVTFADKQEHQLFLEPEGPETNEYYLNGFSSSLPVDVQIAALKTIPALRNLKIYRPGYAIEYDFFDPTQLWHTLETKIVKNLYFAGQINGTTGYEEAAGQGLVAGVNAALKVLDREPLELRRDNSYIGVLIDDLVTKGIDEPYRMFTSRAEYRILLRQDNADERLTPLGHAVGLATEKRYETMKEKYRRVEEVIARLGNMSVKPDEINPYLEANGSSPLTQSVRIADLLTRPQVTLSGLMEALPDVAKEVESIVGEDRREEILESIEIRIKYRGYIERERTVADKIRRLEDVKLHNNFDYESLRGLSTEARQKLSRIKPATVGQASRIPGVSPSDINILLLLLGR